MRLLSLHLHLRQLVVLGRPRFLCLKYRHLILFISLIFHLVHTRSCFFIYPSVPMKDKLLHYMASLAWCCCRKYPYSSFRGFQLTPSPAPTVYFNYMTFDPVLLFPCPSHSWKQIKLVNKDVFYIVKGMWQRTKSGSLWTIKPVRFRLWCSITEVHKTLW